MILAAVGALGRRTKRYAGVNGTKRAQARATLVPATPSRDFALSHFVTEGSETVGIERGWFGNRAA